MEALNTNFVVKDTTRGKGVFAKVDLNANQTVMEFTGPLLNATQVSKMPTTNYLQIGPNTFIGLSGKNDDTVSHSCSPNCAVVIGAERAFLKTLYVIKVDTEITFDYSITSTGIPAWSMVCRCGTYGCRKKIGGYATLDTKTKEYYKSLGVVPKYVENE
jgi:hypothetical protein